MSLRVFELAKELGIPNKELINRLKEMDIPVSTHLSVLTDEQVDKVKKISSGSANRDKEITKNLAGVRKVRRRRPAASEEPPVENTPQETPEAAEEPKAETKEPKKKEKVKAEEPVKPAVEEPVTTEKTKEKKEEAKKAPAKEQKAEPVAEKPAAVEEKQAKTKKEEKPAEKKESQKGKDQKPAEKKQEAKHDKSSKDVKKKSAPEVKRVVDDAEEKKQKKVKRKGDNEVEAAPKKIKVPANAGVRDLDDSELLKSRNKYKDPRKSRKNRDRGGKWQDKKKPQEPKHTFNPRKKEIKIGDVVTVAELASSIGIKAAEIIKTLMGLGIMATINQPIDGETATLVAEEFGVEIKVQADTLEDSLEQAPDADKDLKPRPPVVTIMGHVDHGKTSLLDKIRQTSVTSGEAGGITQHIGAYHVSTEAGDVSFLDTPGHEAFTAMRARGANATDIVILVVAADDGPKPQTVEAIAHARAAEVPIIVAINKVDKPDASPEKTMQMLMEHNLIAEEYGGDITMVRVSAKSGEGIDELLEMVLLQAETMELKANEECQASGLVIESRVDKGRGNLVTLLVQRGTLRQGDNMVAGTEYGRVRAMFNDQGKQMKEAGPSFPVEILGLNGLPKAGDKFNVGSDEKVVRQIASVRSQKEKEKEQEAQHKLNLENMFKSMGQDEQAILNLIVKADVVGSLEALNDALARQGNDKVAVKIIHGSVGAISTADVTLASASGAVIIGFNVRPDAMAKKIAQDEGVETRIYSVIYDAIEDVHKALEGMLEPVIREEEMGTALIQEVYNIPKVGVVAGCKVTDGKILKESHIRVLRDNVVIHNGRLNSLKRFKDDAKEVMQGFECGMGLENYKDLKVGDILESYLRTEEAAEL